MALVKEIELPDGGVIRMRASALIPRLYRIHFQRDMIRDMTALQDSVKAVKDGDKPNLDLMDLTIFEDLAWLMARHADSSVPNDPDKWLEGLDHVLDIYEILPQMMDLWTANTETTSIPAKK